jgi:hypothetical protein
MEWEFQSCHEQWDKGKVNVTMQQAMKDQRGD